MSAIAALQASIISNGEFGLTPGPEAGLTNLSLIILVFGYFAITNLISR